MIKWGYIHEIRLFNKSSPICLNRCFWAITSCPQRTRGNRNLNGAGLPPSLSAGFNDGHFAWEMTGEKLVRPDWRTRLRSTWSDLNYIWAVTLLEHLQICILHRSSLHAYMLVHMHLSGACACTHTPARWFLLHWGIWEKLCELCVWLNLLFYFLIKFYL